MKLEWISSPSRAKSTEFGFPSRWLPVAQSPSAPSGTDDRLNFVVEFTLSGERYGILESELIEIVAVSLERAAALPDGRPGYPGFVDFRGEPLGLIDLSVLAGGEALSGANVPCLLPNCQTGVGYLVESIVSMGECDLTQLGAEEMVSGFPVRTHPSGTKMISADRVFGLFLDKRP